MSSTRRLFLGRPAYMDRTVLTHVLMLDYAEELKAMTDAHFYGHFRDVLVQRNISQSKLAEYYNRVLRAHVKMGRRWQE
jgi:hypothetical protein